MPIHVAITRQVRAGSEEEFQRGLQEFFKTSFGREGVHGASMLVPSPGSGSREYGILRTFADENERDAFYKSPMFAEWEGKARTLTEGEPVYRQLHGLEAWFRSPSPPPRWKMAVATFLGVLPTVMLLSGTLGTAIKSWSFLPRNVVFNACVVAALTWVVMPVITRLLGPWLHSTSNK
jgi:antibiotic biosynthesis monooxygenase (ABM) superfamily enzyme